MNKNLKPILEQIKQLEAEYQFELDKQNKKIRQQFSKLDAAIVREHRKIKTGMLQYIAQANLLIILTAPIIYSLVIAFALLDLMVSIYQAICFRVYKIPLVPRKDYFSYDRSKLGYLNLIEKINCAYCSYGNGVIAYTREVASRTEKYWCPIKHAATIRNTHEYYRLFEKYGDGKNYHVNLEKHRDALSKIDKTS